MENNEINISDVILNILILNTGNCHQVIFGGLLNEYILT